MNINWACVHLHVHLFIIWLWDHILNGELRVNKLCHASGLELMDKAEKYEYKWMPANKFHVNRTYYK